MMSRIRFHTKQLRVEVSGAERAGFHVLCQNIFWSILENNFQHGLQLDMLKRLSRACSANPEFVYISDAIHKFRAGIMCWDELSRHLDCFFSVHIDDIQIRKEFNLFHLPLNTAYLLGSDLVKLAARIHGTCEIHGWIDGPNKIWVADIIERSLQAGIYRQLMGWDNVLGLLRQDNIEPIVMSYSVCDSFPNPRMANFLYDLDEYDEPDYSRWEALPEDEQWDIAFDALKKSDYGLEIKPDGWNDFYFGDAPDDVFTFAKALLGS